MSQVKAVTTVTWEHLKITDANCKCYEGLLKSLLYSYKILKSLVPGLPCLSQAVVHLIPWAEVHLPVRGKNQGFLFEFLFPHNRESQQWLFVLTCVWKKGLKPKLFQHFVWSSDQTISKSKSGHNFLYLSSAGGPLLKCKADVLVGLGRVRWVWVRWGISGNLHCVTSPLRPDRSGHASLGSNFGIFIIEYQSHQCFQSDHHHQ